MKIRTINNMLEPQINLKRKQQATYKVVKHQVLVDCVTDGVEILADTLILIDNQPRVRFHTGKVLRFVSSNVNILYWTSISRESRKSPEAAIPFKELS